MQWNLTIQPSVFDEDTTNVIRLETTGVKIMADSFDGDVPHATINLTQCHVHDFMVLADNKSCMILQAGDGAQVALMLPMGEHGFYNMLASFIQEDAT